MFKYTLNVHILIHERVRDVRNVAKGWEKCYSTFN